ncbi:uncharacterized protein LAJ45_08993 [Morchella importuna]|uniref:uncharacterized protein n=1 Tax=Morchella importuna TaxID=1174673 RepID=UPI001E8D9A87|nr:uncharacterized protein LAJ45_08993 [Morchella importuna]KAH8146914.1 hypothetical protein LAJ45_08993 [Morchella importuna]
MSSPTKPRKWATVRKKFNLIVPHRSTSPTRASSPASTLSAESQAASFCRPYTANPSSTISTTTIDAPPRSPRPVSSPMAFPVTLPPEPTPSPSPAPRAPPPTRAHAPAPPPPAPAAAPAPAPQQRDKTAAKLALLNGEAPDIDPADEAQLAPTTAAEAEWDRLTKANSELNNNLDLYGSAAEKSKGMRKRAKSRVRRKKGVKFADVEDVIGLGGFEVWTTDEESGGEEEREKEKEKAEVRRERERREMEMERLREREKEVGGGGGMEKVQRVRVEVTAPRPPPPPPPQRPQSLPPSARGLQQAPPPPSARGLQQAPPPPPPPPALGRPVPKRPPPPMVGITEKKEMSRKMLPPSVRLVQDDGSF